MQVVMVQDPRLQQELQQKRQKLEAAETNQQQLLGLLQELQQVLKHARVQVPPQLQHRLQDVLQIHQQGQAAAAVPAAGPYHAGPTTGQHDAARQSDPARAAFRGAPLPGMFGDDSDAGDSGYEDEPEQQEHSGDAADSEEDARGAAAGRAGVASRAAPTPGGGGNARGNGGQLHSQQLQGARGAAQRPEAQQQCYSRGQHGQQSSGNQHGSRSGEGHFGHHQQAGHQRPSVGVSEERRTGSSVGQQYDHQQQSGHFNGAQAQQQRGWAVQQQPAGRQHHQQQYGGGGQYGAMAAQHVADAQQYQTAGHQQQWANGNRQHGQGYQGNWQQQVSAAQQLPTEHRSGSHGRSHCNGYSNLYRR